MNKKILPTKYSISLTVSNDPDEFLSSRYNALPAEKQLEFKTSILKHCAWTVSVWLNKLAGRTKLRPLEEMQIESIFNDTLKTLGDDSIA